MKKVLVILIVLISFVKVNAQSNFYLGLEMGSLLERYYYSNELNYTQSQYFMGAAVGPLLGYRLKYFSLETGLYFYISKEPYIIFDVESNEIKKTKDGNLEWKNFVIPFRIGKQIDFNNSKLSIKPEAGMHLHIYRLPVNPNNKGWWKINDEYCDPLNTIENDCSSTLAIVDQEKKTGMGLEASLSINYQLNRTMQFYVRTSYIAQLGSMYSEKIEHFENDRTISANRIKQNIALILLGFRIRLNIQDEIE